jgi:hypothetical protein
MRVFETFFPAGVVRTGAGFFRRRVGIGWRAALRSGSSDTGSPAEQPGHPDDVFKKSTSRIQSAPRLPISAADKFGALQFLNP